MGYVEVVGAAADLLVGGEGEADAAVRDLGVGDEILGSADNLCDAGLVVGAEQGGAGGGDDGTSELLEQVGVLGGLEDGGGVIGEVEILALVVGVHDGLDAGAAHLGGGIDMGHETDGRHALFGGGRGDGGEDVTVIEELDLGAADGAELIGEVAEEVPLLGRAGRRRRVEVGLRVEGDVAEEAFDDAGLEADFGARHGGSWVAGRKGREGRDREGGGPEASGLFSARDNGRVGC